MLDLRYSLVQCSVMKFRSFTLKCRKCGAPLARFSEQGGIADLDWSIRLKNDAIREQLGSDDFIICTKCKEKHKINLLNNSPVEGMD